MTFEEITLEIEALEDRNRNNFVTIFEYEKNLARIRDLKLMLLD